MKKLMIAAAVAVCAMFANAAAVTWSIGAGYAPGTTDELGDVVGYNAFFFVDSITSGATGQSGIYTHADAVAQLAAGKTDFFGNAIGAPVEIEYGAGAGNVGSFATDNTVGGYLVILDNANPADATKAYITDVQTTYINGMGASSMLDWGDITAMQSASAWKDVNTGAVPEPTSGLLMLLGVAGLALRRRRA